MRVAALAAAAFLAWAAPSPAQEPESTLTVSGHGVASAPPDGATFRAGVNALAANAGTALVEANQVIERVQRALAEAGIEPREVRTAQLQVSPQFAQRNRGSDPPTIVGYRVSHVLAVRSGDLDGLGALLDRVLAAGANVVEDIQFVIREPEALVDEARRRAVHDARRRAEVLAAAAGRRLGPIVAMHEGAGASPRPLVRAGMEMSLAGAVPVASGENEYQASVTIAFALR